MVSVNGLVIIGYFVWWTIQQVKISREDFKALLKQVGIDFDIGDKDKEIALRRAAFLKAVREVKGGSKDTLIRKIKKAKDEYVFGLVDETIDKNSNDLSYNHEATMKFKPETGELNCDFTHRAFDKIKPLYEEYTNMLNSDDIRDMLLKIIAQYHRVGVRKRGGIYFVPEKYKDEVEKIEALIDALPGDNYLAVAPQIDSEKSKRAIYKAFINSLKDKIGKFKEELDADSFERKSTWENRIEEFKSLRDEIEFYKDTLEFQAEDLAEELNTLTTEVRKKLDD